LALPPVELPRASRRAGEAGTVWLRVRVGVGGLPTQITLHRSSGHERLDEQALWAMRQARFRPQTENGLPIEWQVIAPIEYPLE
ncbi:MAG: energy transducer TonB, partial [Rubrivivax sp.]|nr:energy transducer TonB [Rubrivivax sp.]